LVAQIELDEQKSIIFAMRKLFELRADKDPKDARRKTGA
jgi:hypothetical protein